MQEQQLNFLNLELFLKFLKGDRRVPDAFRWSVSIRNKITVMQILNEEVFAQLPKCFDEIKEIKEKGLGSGIECTKLAIKYEVFLNSIYALCENLSRIVHYLYKSRLPEGFRKQKSRFLKNLKLTLQQTATV